MFVATDFGIWWGGLFSLLLLAACVTDVRSRRIPNRLVLVILVTGFAFGLATQPWQTALLKSSIGCVLGFSIWIAFWLLGLLGAGDVKFFAAVGAWLGPAATWRAALFAALIGGVLAVATLLRQRQFRASVEKTALALSSRTLSVLVTTNDDVPDVKQHLPYGVALAGGALVAAWLPHILV
jgi:prepilin peptidase CpaA